jgi:hypothetical protein
MSRCAPPHHCITQGDATFHGARPFIYQLLCPYSIHVVPQVLASAVGMSTFGHFMAFSSNAEYLAVSEWPDGTSEVRALLSRVSPGFSGDKY